MNLTNIINWLKYILQNNEGFNLRLLTPLSTLKAKLKTYFVYHSVICICKVPGVLLHYSLKLHDVQGGPKKTAHGFKAITLSTLNLFFIIFGTYIL